jgi:hypothetical protein
MLTTQAVQDPKLDRAIGELVTNAERAAIAGLARPALQALRLLLQPGPWRMPAHGAIVHRVQRVLADVAWLADEASPEVGEQAAVPRARQPAWAAREAAQRLRALAMVGRRQLRPAGADWSPAFFSSLPRHREAFGPFCVDAEFVLKARIARRFGAATAAIGPQQAAELAALGVAAEVLAGSTGSVDSIEIDAAAESTDTLAIARALAGCLRETGESGGYLASFVFQACFALLADSGRAADARDVADAWLAHVPDACARLLDLAVVPAVGDFLRSGHLSEVARVDAEAVREWLAALSSRRTPIAGRGLPANDPAWTPPQSPAEFVATLQGTPLGELDWRRVPVPGNGEHAWVARVPVDARRALWQQARARVERTGRWPLVTTLWSGGAPPDADQLSEDLFGRFSYGTGASRDDLSPRSFIGSAASIDAADVLQELAEQEWIPDEQDQLQSWRDELASTGGSLDGFDEAWAACRGDRLRFERWLVAREAEQGRADPELGRQPNFDPDNAWLVLLPTTDGEDALAYLHWFGLERGTPDGFIALLRRWREAHGAELLAHYGTMLEFVVTRPPQDLDTALSLAREHDLAAPCTMALPGIALRHYALGLVGHPEWFLHERP